MSSNQHTRSSSSTPIPHSRRPTSNNHPPPPHPPPPPPPPYSIKANLTTTLYHTHIGIFALTWSRNLFGRSLHLHLLPSPTSTDDDDTLSTTSSSTTTTTTTTTPSLHPQIKLLIFWNGSSENTVDLSDNREEGSSSLLRQLLPIVEMLFYYWFEFEFGAGGHTCEFGWVQVVIMLQFLYSGQVLIVPQKHEPRPNCGERGCWHTHCTSAVDLALDTLSAARYFGVEQLALLTQCLVQVGFCRLIFFPPDKLMIRKQNEKLFIVEIVQNISKNVL